MPTSLQNLINDLPEIYQPIFGHPDLASKTSRACNDRLIEITKVYKLLEKELKRPLKVIDLGCAQGFFSLSLAKLGATVYGIDFLDKNIAVCNALAKENNYLNIQFNVNRIEDVLEKLKPNEYDLVLGLSVFHHIVHEHGLQTIQQILSILAKKINVGMFELALAEEPLYWGPSQAIDPVSLLKGFSFSHELKKYPTHLSNIERPLIVASNYYWIVGNNIEKFNTFKTNSHVLSNNIHKKTRYYFFNDKKILKQYKLTNEELYKNNLIEFKNEVAILTHKNTQLKFSKIFDYAQEKAEAWIIREKLEGKLLLDKIMHNEDYDADKVIRDILEQLVKLENIELYYNDLRTWNILIDKNNNATIIDYGSIVAERKDCTQPNNLFLVFILFMHEVINRNVTDPAHRLNKINFDLNSFPHNYKSKLITFFLLPEENISFNKLYEILYEGNDYNNLYPYGFSVLNTALSQVIKKYLEKIEHNSVIAIEDCNKKVHTWWEKATEAEKKLKEVETQSYFQIEKGNQQTHEWWKKATEAEKKLKEVETQSYLQIEKANQQTHEWWEKATEAEKRLQEYEILNSRNIFQKLFSKYKG